MSDSRMHWSATHRTEDWTGTYHISGPKPRPRYEGPSELLRLLDEAVAKAEEEIRWTWHLDLNEYLWGSAYGPWRTPEFVGLEVLTAAAPGSGGPGSGPPGVP